MAPEVLLGNLQNSVEHANKNNVKLENDWFIGITPSNEVIFYLDIQPFKT